jgi:hypothetical protein
VFSRSSGTPDDLLILQGRDAILGQASLLQELAQCCGQPGAMHWLEYFLNRRAAERKPPFLVLHLEHPSDADRLSLGNVRAAALFFEYRILGLRTRAFSTDDAVGFRTVIAPAQERAAMATRAAQALIQQGAHIVLATYDACAQEEGCEPVLNFPGLLAGLRRRDVRRFLEIGPSFDETLARLGRLTRRNVRYYRRRLSARTPCELVPDVGAYITLDELHAFNRGSINPVSADEVNLRWRSASRLPGSFLMGLRTSGGEWLSFVGGWRQGTTTVLHWQMNTAGHEHDSISTVMRSFFLEHEAAHGTRRLLMYGGTPHSIRHSFERESIADVLICRPSLRAKLLRLLARTVASPRGITGRINFLAQTLSELPMSACEDVTMRQRRPSNATLSGPRGLRP